MSICDASSSWSGYQYQGKVSIYMVLKIINDFIEQGLEEEYKNYDIEIEHREDFSIKYNGKYKSIHQVKARMDDTTINPYLEAMEKLNNDKREIPSLTLYLHTICGISDWDIEGYKKCLNKKIKRLKKSESDKNKESVAYLTNILSEESFFNNVNLYRYSNGNYHCSLDDIKDLITDEIQRYFILTGQINKTGSTNIEIIYNQFIGFLDNYIKERHKGNISVDIRFSEFKSKLDDHKILERDEIYYIYLTRERYVHNMSKYCERRCSKRKSCKYNVDECKLKNIVNLIIEMSLKDFKKLIYKINPHININDWERDNNEFSQPQNIYFLCRTINEEIEKTYAINNNSILYSKNMNNYMPTTIGIIDEYDLYESLEEYTQNIKNNDFLLSELFETNIFITKNLDKVNILEDIGDVEEIDEDKRAKDLELEDKLYLKNRVDFRSLEHVKRELI
ncbi:ABC-three component system protein [Romboutsia ilealis]|uniref:ABC-three component system protein n=1 Tax=Romboutsia ilealis TaxID=1115758 RepID=UPI0023F1A6D1|nr:ABC-three component system protein [Romboutsia ilealis]